MRLPISAFLVCQNEEAVIAACIRSLAMCAEIVAVDGGSTDGTLAVLEGLAAEGLPLRIIREPWRGFGAQKQFALDQCTEDWCLSIDADERVSPRLAAALPELIAQAGVDGWKITGFDYLAGFGYVPRRAHDRFHLRLFRRDRGRFDLTDLVHEGVRVEGTVARVTQGGLMHFSPVRVERQIAKFNRYSSLKAEMRAARGARAQPWKMLASPVHSFLRWYLAHGLWRCGWAGVVRAANNAVYAYMTEAKRWEAEAVRRLPPVEPPAPEGY